jgi:GTP cyclohydrolase I
VTPPPTLIGSSPDTELTGALGIDHSSAEHAASAFLAALGVRLDSPHLQNTPRRMAAAFAELLTPPAFEPTSFDADGYNDLVLVGDMPFHSLCAHHVLPFVGTVDIAYMPTGAVLGLSKLAWAVQTYSRRLQVQEQLTRQLADWLVAQVQPEGVAVRVRAEHMCMSLRGVRARGAVTTTFAERGVLVNDPRVRQMWAAAWHPAG